MKIGLFDPGIEDNLGTKSSNLGDLIIQAAIDRELKLAFDDTEIFRISTQSPIPPAYFPQMHECRHLIVGGTNLLTSFMRDYKQWQITWSDAWRIRRAVLLGIGWWQYQKRPDWHTWFTLLGALSWRGIHSVRDEYSCEKLRALGFQNVLNTGCPTMWPFLEFDQESIPRTKSDNVLLMLTDYYRNYELDTKVVNLMLANYQNVYFWPQGRKDLEYLDELNLPVRRLEHTLDSLDDFLCSGIAVDYIGTRLHGGIRCLLAGKRALVLEVDNRAAEVGRDTGLPTAKREDFDAISRWIQGPGSLDIRMNRAAIEKWRAQFHTDDQSTLTSVKKCLTSNIKHPISGNTRIEKIRCLMPDVGFSSSLQKGTDLSV